MDSCLRFGPLGRSLLLLFLAVAVAVAQGQPLPEAPAPPEAACVRGVKPIAVYGSPAGGGGLEAVVEDDEAEESDTSGEDQL
ncbi:hypothetical protein chiPu_0027857, partial [Chiloscyllium punctatum]|nr:hypothetical protein [Chiloscyllium punctatum]